MLQDHLDLRTLTEPSLAEVAGADGDVCSRVEAGDARGLATVFGDVTVTRMAYRQPGQADLHPADAALYVRAVDEAQRADSVVGGGRRRDRHQGDQLPAAAERDGCAFGLT